MKQLTRISMIITLLQMVTAVVFGCFTYFQTKLMDVLGEGNASVRLAILTLVLMMGYLFLEFTEQYVREKKVADVSIAIKTESAKAYFQNGNETYLRKNEEQHLSYFTNQIDAVLQQNIYLRFYLQKQFAMIVISVVMLLIISAECSLVIGAVAIVFGLIVHKSSEKLTKKQQDIQGKSATFLTYISELYEGYQEIHVNQLETLAEEEAGKANQSMEDSLQEYRRTALGIETMGIGLNMCIYILILVIGGVLALHGKVGIGVFIVASELSVQILNEWSMIMRLYTLVRGSRVLKEELEGYLHLEERTYEEKSTKEENCLISLQNVCFSYGEKRKILQNVNWQIERGTKYLITGKSGCGKSTLLEVLVGHYLCSSGKIMHHTKKMAYVPQNPFLFPGTLRENIVFCDCTKDEKVCDLLRELRLDLQPDDEIKLDGKNLSGGQCVRIALARALIREPEVLLLDEFASSLDSAIGKQIEEMLLRKYPQMTVVSVAHKVYCQNQYDVELQFTPQGIEVVS